MSALRRLIHTYGINSEYGEDLLREILNDHARELAEKIRGHSAEMMARMGHHGPDYTEGCILDAYENAADLILQCDVGHITTREFFQPVERCS